MASLISTHTFSLPRWQSNSLILVRPSFVRFHELKLQKTWWSLRAARKKKTSESGIEDVPIVDEVAAEKATPKRGRKKKSSETSEEPPISAMVVDVSKEEISIGVSSSEDPKRTPERTRKKATSLPPSSEGESSDKKVSRRKSKKKTDNLDDQGGDLELSYNEAPVKSVSRRKSKKKIDNMDDDLGSDGELSDNEEPVKKVGRRKSKKKIDNMDDDQGSDEELSDNEELAKKVSRRKSKKKIDNMDVDQGSDEELINSEEPVKKVSRRKSENKIENMDDDQESDEELRDHEDFTFIASEEGEEDDLEFPQGGEDDISFTYSWPPLVCCFGSAQHAFVPSGRPANRLMDHKIHERMKDVLWVPEKFVRAPGSSSSNVAIALACLGGRVEFMGKLGNDEYGKTMLYYLNINNVQTRSISVDRKRLTSVSHMRISRRGGLRMTCTKPCAEDSLSRSEINVDVLKEAKMFYFNSSSLLDKDMRSTTLRAIRIARKLGAVIFFDLNLPLPLWKSTKETKMFIQQVWNLSDIIEVTKQELEFLCEIEPLEKFDTKDNDKSKFIHHKPEVIMPLWHENLKVLFVTNGTSKIHYYTEKHNGSVLGMETPPITPFTWDMSASGDGIVAGLMRMLTVQPHLITDKGYLERTIKYAIDCGIIDQWLLARKRGYPPKEGMEEETVADENGIRSITEMQYRTLEPAS